MTSMFDAFLPIFIPALGFCALFMLVFGGWYFATGRRKELAMTEEQRERARVTDPELSPARALYTSVMIDGRVKDTASNSKSGGDDGGSSDGGGGD